MPIAPLHNLADIRRLFAELGYAPADHPYDDDTTVVARLRQFRVLACEDAAPGDRARAVAGHLARRGELGLAAVLAPGRELALAAPEPKGAGRVLRVALAQPDRTAVQLLEELRPRRHVTALAHALRVTDVLGAETAGTRFFGAFRVILERMAGSLDRRHSLDDRRMVALLALTRVLFLYFVQAKGWLDGNTHYLTDLLDAALGRGRQFHRSYLIPLFFGSLNRPARNRSARLRLGAIPYLNGGLFEPHAVERRIRRPYISNALWRDAFDTVFERFRFCVREADEVDAIAPDMLGHVFERLMAPADRLDSGTFYTPESVVREVVTATLEAALTGLGVLGRDAAHAFARTQHVRHERRAAVACTLAELRVLDPAVGSGAFLLGALDCITELRLAVAQRPTPNGRLRLRRDILARNLFGVDVNPIAVRLAELRLWLALIADDPTADITRVTPLPNLHGVVRQGDSLLDPLAAARRSVPGSMQQEIRKLTREIVALRAQVFDARGAERATALHSLAGAERRLARPLIESALLRTRRDLAELDALERRTDLFGKRPGLDPHHRAARRALERQRAEIERARMRLGDGAVPFFSFDVHAPDASAAGGFDAVVGNPPWVRSERLDPATRSALRDRFAWWHADGGRGFAHLPDLAVAFLERSLALTRPGGAVGMLLPSKVVTAGYAEQARRALVREATIEYVHRIPDRQARQFGATTYPLALVVRKSAPPDDHVVALGLDRADTVRQRDLARPGPWILVPEGSRRAVDAFLASGTPFASTARLALGVKTGADRLFVGTLLSDDSRTAVVCLAGESVEIERTLLRDAVRGRDVLPFGVRPRRVVLWTHDVDGGPRRTLPPRAAAFLARHREALLRRADYRRGPPWTLFRERAAQAGHRLVWADIAQRPIAVVLEATRHTDAIPLNTCYVGHFPDRTAALAACAVMNSIWCAAYVALSADEARGGFRRINAGRVAPLPLPPSGAARHALADLAARRHTHPPRHDADLDEAVADALDLSAQCRAALRRVAANHLARPAHRS